MDIISRLDKFRVKTAQMLIQCYEISYNNITNINFYKKFRYWYGIIILLAYVRYNKLINGHYGKYYLRKKTNFLIVNLFSFILDNFIHLKSTQIFWCDKVYTNYGSFLKRILLFNNLWKMLKEVGDKEERKRPNLGFVHLL